MGHVKLIIFNNGLQIVGDLVEVDKETTKVVLKKPVQLFFTQAPEGHPTQGKVGMAFTPFLQYTEEWEQGIGFSISDVLSVVTPTIELLNNYNSSFGSGLVLPATSGLRI